MTEPIPGVVGVSPATEGASVAAAPVSVLSAAEIRGGGAVSLRLKLPGRSVVGLYIVVLFLRSYPRPKSAGIFSQGLQCSVRRNEYERHLAWRAQATVPRRCLQVALRDFTVRANLCLIPRCILGTWVICGAEEFLAEGYFHLRFGHFLRIGYPDRRLPFLRRFSFYVE